MIANKLEAVLNHGYKKINAILYEFFELYDAMHELCFSHKKY